MAKINWYPSEYLYLDKDGTKYCMAADKSQNYEIMFGTTLMRQNDFIFDIDKKQIGIARANCSDDPLMIQNEDDYTAYGIPFPHASGSISKKEAEKDLDDYHICKHNKTNVDDFITKETKIYMDFYGIEPKVSAG